MIKDYNLDELQALVDSLCDIDLERCAGVNLNEKFQALVNIEKIGAM